MAGNAMIRHSLRCLLLIVAGGASIYANAATIHKWVDEKGVTHYSDSAPGTTGTTVTQIEIDTRDVAAQATDRGAGDYYSIANQWQRMNQERLQRQQFELQRAAQSIEAQATRPPAPEQYDSASERYAVVYPGQYFRHGHGRPGAKPRGHRANRHSAPGQHNRGQAAPTGIRMVN
jgi:hypothetical protein